MHYLIVWQNDREVEPKLQRLLGHGAGNGIIPLGGHHVRLFQMQSQGSPKGEWYDSLMVMSAIVSMAANALQTADRLAEMDVMFIFHQTSKPAVNAIIGALKLLTPDVLDRMAQAASKDLKVQRVVLLSCESATDKVVPQPVPQVLAGWVAQASDMRSACFDAFTIRKIDGSGQWEPLVVTFSTGNVVTGGIVLDPWRPQFISLHGHFTPTGDWEYDRDANGQPDKRQDPSGGTWYVDRPGGAEPSTSVGPGQSLPLLPDFPLPP